MDTGSLEAMGMDAANIVVRARGMQVCQGDKAAIHAIGRF